MSTLADLSARDLLDGYAARAFSPVEAVAACYERIERLDGDLNAWQALCRDRAGEQARAAEAQWRRDAHADRPLLGVPIAVKDLFDTAGIETACGSALLRGRVPDADAEVVRRVRAAGAIVLGKTSTHEFACGLTMVNEHLGDTRNPFDSERTPGGSSGGSAVALATGMAPLALGTDTGGSIRWPAAACGVVGFKPTFGSVAMDGCWPLAPSLDHVGPMACTVDDVALLWAAIRDQGSAGAESSAELVGVPREFGVAVAPSVRAALDDAARRLGEAGYAIREVEIFDHMYAREVFFGLFHPEILRTHTRLGLWPDRKAQYTANVRTRLEIAEGYTDADYERAQTERQALRAQADATFRQVSLVLTPVCAAPVPRFDDLKAIREIVTPFTCPQDVLGLPACAVRAGTDENGVPIGVQLTGPAGEDAMVLSAAGLLY